MLRRRSFDRKDNLAAQPTRWPLHILCAVAALVLVGALGPAPAFALQKCRARVVRADGSILVSAENVTEALRWRWDAEQSYRAVDSAECVRGGWSGGCALAGVDSLARRIPPPDCFLELADAEDACRTYVRGCIPAHRQPSLPPPSPLPCLSTEDSGGWVVVEGCNVHIRNGTGSTAGTPDGTGNLILGWNEGPHEFGQSGSHNVIIGERISFTGYGALATGTDHHVTGSYATILTGQRNHADSGFIGNGFDNRTLGGAILGGAHNYAEYGAVVGGYGNMVLGATNLVVGGKDNRADGLYTGVFGGQGNRTEGRFTVVAGGLSNAAAGEYTLIAGGEGNRASGSHASVLGGLQSHASGKWSTVTGGILNSATGIASTVSGGLRRTAEGEFDWVAGSLFEDE